MPYTVVHQGGTKDSEYQAYLRLLSRQLLKHGINLDNLPRVKEEDTGRAWLYVWEDQDEAAAFAKDLKMETRDSHWHVQPVKAKPSFGPLRPLEIHVGRQRDGWTFALEPLTRKAIQNRVPGSCRHHNVFIGSQTPDDFTATQGELRDLTREVLFILTGLGAEQLRSFGSFRLVDPVEAKELIPPTPLG